jgi:hypothetical protein
VREVWFFAQVNKKRQVALCATLRGRVRTLEAIRACDALELWSATYVKDYLKRFHMPSASETPVIPISDKKYHASAEKRSIEAYVKAGGLR